MKEHKDGIYQGQLNQKKQKHGLGIYLWDAGQSYYGEWKNDYIDGQGILFLGGQIIIQGGFRKGVPQGEIVIKVGDRVFYSQFDKGEALFIQEGQKRIMIQSSTAHVLTDCHIEAERILQSISKLSTQDLSIQLFNTYIHYGSIGKASLPDGLGIQISSYYYKCGVFKEGKLHGLGRFETIDEIYQGYFEDDIYSGNGLKIFKDQGIKWIKGSFNNGNLIEIKKSGMLDFLNTPSDLAFSYSKKGMPGQYLIVPISKEIILGYIKLFEIMQFVRMRVNTVSETHKPQISEVNRRLSTFANSKTSKSLEDIQKNHIQYNSRNLQQQNHIYQIILNQHDDTETQRKIDTQQQRIKTQPEENCDNKISFGILDLKESRKTAAFDTEDYQIQRSQSQNEVNRQSQQHSNNDRMLLLKNILEAQKSKYIPGQNSDQQFVQEQQTAIKYTSLNQSQQQNLIYLSEGIKKELNQSLSDERRSTIKPLYNNAEEQENSIPQFSQKSKNNNYQIQMLQHKNKIHHLLQKFNNIKLQEVKNTGLPMKSSSSKMSIQKVFENSANSISLVSHKEQKAFSQEKYNSKKLNESSYQSLCANCTINQDNQNNKYILEIRQELAEQKQILTQLCESLKKSNLQKCQSTTPQRHVQPRQIYFQQKIYPAFTILKQVSPVRL